MKGVRLRPDGRYEARLHFTTADGRVRKSFYARTEREAMKARDAARTALAAGKRLDVPDLPVSAYLARWLEESVRPRRTAATYAAYEAMCRVHLVPTLGRIRLDKLQPEDVERLLNRALAAGKSSATVRQIRTVLAVALQQAVRRRHLTHNVAALAEAPPLEREEVVPYTADEVRMLLAALRGDRLEAIVTLAIATGLRVSELLGLRWQDVDLDAAALQVVHKLERVENKRVLSRPKTAATRRPKALPPFAVTALRAHRVHLMEQRLLSRGRWADHDLVFPTELGNPWERQAVYDRFQTFLRRAGLRRLSFHALRHAYSSLLADLGVAAEVRRDALGHTRLEMTAHYTHTQLAAQRDAATRLDTLLAGPLGSELGPG